MHRKISACILAAGEGKRMGRTKQLLPIDGKPMLQYVMEKVLHFPFEKVYTVIGHDHEAILEAVQIKDKRLVWLVNDAYKDGQSTSLKKVFQEESTNLLIFLGDLPFISLDTIQRMIELGNDLGKTAGPTLIRPTYKQDVGHPVLIGNMTRGIIEQLEGDEGFRSVQGLLTCKKFIPVQDPFIHFDIDRPAQYEAALKMMQELND